MLIAEDKVEAVIFIGVFSESYLRTALKTNLPFVLPDCFLPGFTRNSVTSDYLNGGFLLTRHLLDQGRREIGFVGNVRAASGVMCRYLRYRWALGTEGLTPRREWILEDRDPEGLPAGLILPDPPPQAFLCSCDETAYYLADLLRGAGKQVPGDAAVCGYNGVPLPTHAGTPLTAYQVDLEQMAEAAVMLLRCQFQNGETISGQFEVAGRLIIRDSA